MKDLQGPRRAAKSGTADSLVIFVHGYGADGNDLISIGDAMAPHLPDTAFAAPNAPSKCTVNPFGFQWFPIPWLDGSTEAEAATGMLRAADLLNRYFDEAMSAEGVRPDRTVLFGFSQGTMMCLHIAPRRAESFAGIVGFSGRLLRPKALAAETCSRPPVFLVHGDRDDVVPPDSLAEAASALKQAGFDVRTHVSRGMGHGIAPEALGMALGFIQERLGS